GHQEDPEACQGHPQGRVHSISRSGTPPDRNPKEALRVHQLASLLVKVDASDDTSQILCADALYQMDRLDEAHKVLMETLPQASQRSAILSRLSFLELKKGSSYVSNQLLKEIIQSGKTSCFLPVMKILKEGDRTLMQHHCRAEATSVLRKKQGDNYVKEAIGHLTLALITAGYDAESLLARACCYGQLGQKKTAMFDLNAILKEDPTNAHALSGKGFIHLALNQKKEAIHDLISAFKANPGVAVAEILSLKQEAQMRLHQWLQDHCKTKLRDQVGNEDLVAGNTSKDLAIVAELLLQIYSKSAKNHILYVDALAIVGRSEEALDYLQGAFGCSTPDDSVNSRIGMLQAQKGNVKSALRILAPLAAKDFADLNYLMGLLDAKLRHSLAQAAARKGSTLLEKQHHTKALGYYSLAILASNGNPQFLRQRARCLAHLKEYRKALEDMSRVVQNHARSSLKTQVKDYCLQGQMLLCLSEEALAVQQYIKALELEKSLTLTHLPAHPEAYAKAFLQTAQSCLAENNYEEAWKITGYGLLIHPNNNELKKLRSVIKQETSACRVQ
uniref:Tetratricopeptide repeat domain 34 n=1 Tax=Salvator merianae TaxID=96440 RepID=A0A8D0BRY6_SALMN